MPQNLERQLQRFNALSVREKLMTCGTVVVVVWAIWDNMLYQSLSRQAASLKTEIATLENNLATQRLVADQLKHLDRSNPGEERLNQLQAAVDRLKQQLNVGEKKFVSAQMMATALRDMLQQHGNLKLVKLETLPTTPFANDNDEKQPAWVYRHTLALTLQGDFFSTLNYLQALEALPWRVHWDSIDYQVLQYPDAETRIQVYTLSFEKDWLGV